MKAGVGDPMRQQSKPASSAEIMEKQFLAHFAEGDPVRNRSTLNVQLTKDEFTTSDPTSLHQPTHYSEEALKEVVLLNESLTFGKMRSQLMKLGSATPEEHGEE